jgi:CDP-6-deoxy-D-xylo-4-hexulose-3-dehydrase
MKVGKEERRNLNKAADELLLCANHYAAQFETDFAAFMGKRHCSLTNSGSSANLLALAALELEPGSEVITTAASFPTTVNPIIQLGLRPVFLDCTIPGYNADLTQLERARTSQTKAVMLAHALGNPFDFFRVQAFCEEHGLALIEDCCDAVGSKHEGIMVGSWGDLATVSFYPAHHLTMGEGGAVLTNYAHLKRAVNSYRDWGRDCFCPPGKDNTCKKRFTQKHGELPLGYDHKYVYGRIGWNLKVTEFQAAVGVAQLDKLPEFIATRKRNHRRLTAGMADMTDQ